MEELIVHLEFAKILVAFALGVIVITSITYLIFRKSRIIKYIPGLILILIGIYNLYYIGGHSTTLEGVNRLLIVVTMLITGLIGLLTGLIIGIFTKGRE